MGVIIFNKPGNPVSKLLKTYESKWSLDNYLQQHFLY